MYFTALSSASAGRCTAAVPVATKLRPMPASRPNSAFSNQGSNAENRLGNSLPAGSSPCS